MMIRDAAGEITHFVPWLAKYEHFFWPPMSSWWFGMQPGKSLISCP